MAARDGSLQQERSRGPAGGRPAARPARFGEAPRRRLGDPASRPFESLIGPHFHDVTDTCAAFFECCDRKIEPSPAQFGRQVAQRADQRAGDRDRPCRAARACLGDSEDVGREQRKPPGRRLAIGLEGGEVGRRRGIEVARPGVDQRDEPLEGQAVPGGGSGHGRDDGMAAWPAGNRALQALAPPLQADLAEYRLADLLGDAGELVVERVKREQPLARLGRGEKRAEEAVGIALADDRRDLGEGVGQPRLP